MPQIKLSITRNIIVIIRYCCKNYVTFIQTYDKFNIHSFILKAQVHSNSLFWVDKNVKIKFYLRMNTIFIWSLYQLYTFNSVLLAENFFNIFTYSIDWNHRKMNNLHRHVNFKMPYFNYEKLNSHFDYFNTYEFIIEFGLTARLKSFKFQLFLDIISRKIATYT